MSASLTLSLSCVLCSSYRVEKISTTYQTIGRSECITRVEREQSVTRSFILRLACRQVYTSEQSIHEKDPVEGKKYSELELCRLPFPFRVVEDDDARMASRTECDPTAVPVPASDREDLELDSLPRAEVSPVVRCPPPPEQMRTNSRHIMTTALSCRKKRERERESTAELTYNFVHVTVCDTQTNALGMHINLWGGEKKARGKKRKRILFSFSSIRARNLSATYKMKRESEYSVQWCQWC